MFQIPSSITPAELKEKLLRGDEIVVLDVREQDEFNYVRLENSVWIPLRDLPSRVHELDPDAEMVTLCHLGIRSFQAQMVLKAMGFTKVSNLAGGIDAWALQMDPNMKRYR